MFQSSNTAAHRAHARLPLVQGLTVSIPTRPTLSAILDSLKYRDKDKETTIIFTALLLSSQDMQRIVDAFSHVEANANVTIIARELFLDPRTEDPNHVRQFWNAIKGKVRKIIWEGNKFHERFRKFLNKEIKDNVNVTAQNEFLHTDITDSSTQMNSHTPSSVKSASQSPLISPPPHPSPQALQALSVFAFSAAALHAAPEHDRQVSAP